MSRSALIFQPSPMSYGFWADDDPEEVQASTEGRVPYGPSMVDAVRKVNIWSGAGWSTGVLESLSGLQHMDLMKPVAAADGEARLKAAYWLHVAARTFGRGSDSRSRLETKADGLADRGSVDVSREGSAARQSNITMVYADAANALKSELDAAGGGHPVQQQVYAILAKGALADNVKAAISRRKAQVRAVIEDNETRKEAEDDTPCADTLWGKIPGYCELQGVSRAVTYGVGGLLLLGAAAWAYKQVRS